VDGNTAEALTDSLTLKVEPEMLDSLDDFRFDRRYPNRASAVRELLGWALKNYPSDRAAQHTRERRGGDQRSATRQAS
jgi:Arc/MetJ-type ribon-helix-helix transcriptional regulator